MAGCRPVDHLQSVLELRSGLLKTDPASGRGENLNPDLWIASPAPQPLDHLDCEQSLFFFGMVSRGTTSIRV